jgi:glycosyltransferase involved in cell wall biosynthesis
MCFAAMEEVTPRGQRERGARHVRIVPDPVRYAVDVVIPVYNEERVLAQSISALHDFLGDVAEPGCEWRIVIADNASTDGTLTVARELAARLPGVEVLHVDQKGRGRALKTAWLGSRADVLSYMDVDLSTDLTAFPALIRAIVHEGYDVATGRRLGPGARVIGRKPLRELTSRCYNLLIKLLFPRSRFTDAQCGFKALSRAAAQALLPRVRDTAWFFDTELLLLADGDRLGIKQIPVLWMDDPDSRVNVARTAWEDIKGLWRLRTSPKSKVQTPKSSS